MMPDTYWDLFAAYSFFWIVIAGFVFRLRQGQKAVARELDSWKRQ